MTNFDYIKKMSVDELATFLAEERLGVAECVLRKGLNEEQLGTLANDVKCVIKKWLKKEWE